MIEGKAVHFFQSSEDAWQWLQSKGLGAADMEHDSGERGWTTRKSQRRRNRRPRGRPSPEQAECSKVLADITFQHPNRYRELSRDSDQESVEGLGAVTAAGDKLSPLNQNRTEDCEVL